jgi:Glyoxalase-like domain
MHCQVDHLVIAARSLAEGVAWCEATLGITPGPGGEHPLFGTHNRLFRIATVNYPRAYCEIIAINTEALCAGKSRGNRWFDLDSPAMKQCLQSGPSLVHFVANTADIQQACGALRVLGMERGPAVQASRMTPQGLLQWQITVRPDGQRLYDGCLPTLIEWGEMHPAQSLPDSGIALRSLQVEHTGVAHLQAAYQAIGLQGVSCTAGDANLIAELITPNGRVRLESRRA